LLWLQRVRPGRLPAWIGLVHCVRRALPFVPDHPAPPPPLPDRLQRRLVRLSTFTAAFARGLACSYQRQSGPGSTNARGGAKTLSTLSVVQPSAVFPADGWGAGWHHAIPSRPGRTRCNHKQGTRCRPSPRTVRCRERTGANYK